MNTFRTIPQIAALSLFAMMIGGFVGYRYRTSRPVESLPDQEEPKPPAPSKYSFSATLHTIRHDRLPSTKVAIIFHPTNHKDTVVTHEAMQMRQNITWLTASDTAEYAVIYRRIVEEASRNSDIIYGRDGEVITPKQYHHTLDSLNAWLLFKFRPEKLKISYPQDLNRFQKILKENAKKVPDEHKKYMRRPSDDTLNAIKQLLSEKWPR
jgi:hypothetical protein